MFEAKTIQESCVILETDIQKGLSAKEAERRLRENGTNTLKTERQKTVPERFLEQLNNPLIYVLLASAVISVLLHEINDAVIILFVVCMNAVVGMIQEGKAQKALDALKKLSSPKAHVIRDGREQEIPAEHLVKGDLVYLEAGGQVPADLRLVRCLGMQAEESALTGEAAAVSKDEMFLAEKDRPLPLGDRKNIAYMSTVVTSGRGMGIVTAVGMDTEMGKIAAMISADGQEQTPLQKKLGELGTMLSVLSLILCAALFTLSVVQKRNVVEMLITAISLAVAAVPEGLPAVVTICLALSVTRMVRVNTIVRKLPAVETLGAVSVVCSDKTGTLTQNKMKVERIFPDSISDGDRKELLNVLVLCNDAVLDGTERLGDPTELALLDLAAENGIFRRELEKEFPRMEELAFESERKMMSTFHENRGRIWQCVKGAPDEILKKCSYVRKNGKVVPIRESDRRQIREETKRMADQALRTLAAAMRTDVSDRKEEQLIFLGIVGMRDPERPEAAEAVRKFAGAGVDTVMITGDHVDTAYAIARRLGIADRREQCMTEEEMHRISEEEFLGRLDRVRVFARVSPASKVRIVKGFRAKGKIVAMTGDGVNDAPSLKSADIGIAMGMNGTDVARQAADMILTDDNFATIERAIEEGRGVYENIRKSVIFLLSSNLGEIMTMFLAVSLGLASPLCSSHILWINLITDSLPALALGADKNDGEMLMRRRPRDPKKGLFADGGLSRTMFYGFLIAGISLTAFFQLPCAVLREQGIRFSFSAFTTVLQNPEILGRAQTYAFTVLGLSQLFHAVGMRDRYKSFFQMNHLENKLMIAAFIIGLGLQVAVTEVPLLTVAFDTAHLSMAEWFRLIILAAFPLLAHELLVLLNGKEQQICPIEKTNKML